MGIFSFKKVIIAGAVVGVSYTIFYYFRKSFQKKYIYRKIELDPELVDFIYSQSPYLLEPFSNGFQFSDIYDVSKRAMNVMKNTYNKYSTLDEESRKISIVALIHHVIDQIDIPWLPDNLIDPILKQTAEGIIELVFTLENNGIRGAINQVSEELDDEEKETKEFEGWRMKLHEKIPKDWIKKTVKSLIEPYVNNYSLIIQFKLIPECFKATRKLSENITISPAEQNQLCVELLRELADVTDLPGIPDNLTDPIFKKAAPHLVKLCVAAENGMLGLISIVN